MIHIDFTPEQIDALHHERFHHPHPRVQLKMEAVYLKSQGLPHHDICRLARISENTLRSYLRQFQEGGVERLKRTDWDGTESELDEHRETLEDHFRNHPPRSTAQAAAEIERITGVRRGPTQVRQFLKGLGLKFRKLGHDPGQGRRRRAGEVPRRASSGPGCGRPSGSAGSSASSMPPTSSTGRSWATSGASCGCWSAAPRAASGSTSWGRSTRSRTS